MKHDTSRTLPIAILMIFTLGILNRSCVPPDPIVSPTPTNFPPTETPTPNNHYYVSSAGNDNNPGTLAQPFLTIQKATGTAIAGDTVKVLAGNYPERVMVTRSGITLEAEGMVVMRGFSITASDTTIRGFEITDTPDDSQDGFGIRVIGKRCTLENNYIHDATRGGILLFAQPGYETLTSDCVVRDNRLYRNSQFGIDIRGRNHLIEGNEIWGTIQHHPDWADQPGWVDADGFHFHGSGHIIRGNHIHDILYSDPGNVNPHIDCFQTFLAKPYQEAASDVIIERNRCDNAQSQTSLQVGKGFMLQDANNILIRNNLIHAYVGVKADHGSDDLTILNNTFTSNVSFTTAHSPSGISLTNVLNAIIQNNIFFNLPGHIIYLQNSSVNGGRNLMFRIDGQALQNSDTYSHENDFWGVDPLFVSATDFHLAVGSPAIDAGLAVPVATDFDGNPRPQGAGYDIGAYER